MDHGHECPTTFCCSSLQTYPDSCCWFGVLCTLNCRGSLRSLSTMALALPSRVYDALSRPYFQKSRLSSPNPRRLKLGLRYWSQISFALSFSSSASSFCRACGSQFFILQLFLDWMSYRLRWIHLCYLQPWKIAPRSCYLPPAYIWSDLSHHTRRIAWTFPF